MGETIQRKNIEGGAKSLPVEAKVAMARALATYGAGFDLSEILGLIEFSEKEPKEEKKK